MSRIVMRPTLVIEPGKCYGVTVELPFDPEADIGEAIAELQEKTGATFVVFDSSVDVKELSPILARLLVEEGVIPTTGGK